MRLLLRAVTTTTTLFVVIVSMLMHRTPLAAAAATVAATPAAPPEACALVAEADVAKIIGNEAPIFLKRPPVERDGAISSSCVYQQAGGAGNTGNIQVQAFPSAAAAQARLKSYGDAMTKAGGTLEPDTVDQLPATFIVSKGGTGELYVVKDSVLLGAGVGTLSADHKVKPLRDRARALLAAALAKV